MPIYSVENPRSVKIEYYIDEKQKGKGIASKALEYVVKDIYERGIFDGFKVTHIEKEIITKIDSIFLSINNDNLASQKVAKKNGFICEEGNNKNSYTYNLSRNDYFNYIQSKKEDLKL